VHKQNDPLKSDVNHILIAFEYNNLFNSALFIESIMLKEVFKSKEIDQKVLSDSNESIKNEQSNDEEIPYKLFHIQ